MRPDPMTTVRRVRTMVALLGLVGVASSATAAAPSSGAARPARASIQDSTIRGMTVSTPRGSSVWASDDMVSTIAELKGLGVNWIAIHPYLSIDTDGTVSWRRSRGRRGETSPAAETEPGEAPDWLRRPIEEAHRQGVKILIKPHIAHWRAYAWRGDISYGTDQEWERFFSSYERWIVQVAAFSRGADGFVVGTELEGTVHHEQRWRDIIAAVRDVYDGPVTYAANWDRYERVGFWDALDSVGIQAYFPVLDESRVAAGEIPTQEAFDRGWSDIMARLRAYSERVGKPVVFTEAGYNNSPRAPYEPWDWESRGDGALLQQRCMIAALRAIENEPIVHGAFLWKWFPGDRIPRDFAMAAPEIRRIIADHWFDGSSPP